jgi:hypothetical protein
VHTGFWFGNLKERGHLEDLDIDERIILKYILTEIELESMHCINLP